MGGIIEGVWNTTVGGDSTPTGTAQYPTTDSPMQASVFGDEARPINNYRSADVYG